MNTPKKCECGYYPDKGGKWCAHHTPSYTATPATPDWEKGIIPQYSKIAVVNEDRVDGYEMIPATDFINALLTQSRLQDRQELVGKVEALAKVSTNLMDRETGNQNIGVYVRDVLEILKDPK